MRSGFKHIVTFVRNFLFSWLNKEFLIFLFFLALSGAFWLFNALNDTYEYEIKIPVQVTGVPRNVVITTGESDTLRVMVRDKGFAIASYLYGNRLNPVGLGFSTYGNANLGRGVVVSSELIRLIYPHLFSSSKILSVKPDRYTFYFNYGESKRVPVRFGGKATTGRSYYLVDTRCMPKMVTIYANRHLLDSIKYVSTSGIVISDISDTVLHRVPLKHIPGVKMVPSSVVVGFYPDILTEECIDVPVTAINMPEGKVLRTFPARVQVRFVVGASMFRSLSADQFRVVVDYNELQAHPSDKCTLRLQRYPQSVRRIRLSMPRIDYLIEQQ